MTQYIKHGKFLKKIKEYWLVDKNYSM